MRARTLIHTSRRNLVVGLTRCHHDTVPQIPNDTLLVKEWHLDKQIRRLILNQPEKRVRAVVLGANGPVFSGGHNLRELQTKAGPSLHNEVFCKSTKLIKLIQTVPFPVICGVKGLAAAAGCRLAASCDILVAAENATFTTPGVKIGLFCSTAGTAVGRDVPRKLALDMLITGRAISAQAALENGLVSRIVHENQVDHETLKIAQELCDFSGKDVSSIKNHFYSR